MLAPPCNAARDNKLEDALRAGLARTRIAAVGPVVAAAVEALGASVAIMPDGNFHMKPLVNAICAAVDDDRRKSLGRA